MVCLNIFLTVKKDNDIYDIRNLLANKGRMSREEPGCLRFEVYHSQSDPTVFVLNERWESEEALEAHRNAKAFQEIYKPKVLPRVERVPHVSTLVE